MTYSPTAWVNVPPGTTAPPGTPKLNADDLNHLEQGLAAVDQAAGRPMGAWSNVVSYPANAIVVRSGGTYRATVANINVDPVGNPGTWESWASSGMSQATADTLYDAIGLASAGQAYAIQRANHTGTQAPSTITGTAVVTGDSRLSDQRTPLDGSVSDAKVSAISESKVTGLTGHLAGKVQIGSNGWLTSFAANPDLIVVGAITRDANGAAISAAVTWPDGTPGTYTATVVSSAFPGAVDAYTVTYGSPVTKTVTQPTVTRDATTGAVTVRPAMTVT